jgi:nitrogen-specific signal transduction histidine kinase
MNIYSKKPTWKLLLFITAVIIGIASLWYTNVLVRKLSAEERKKVELWAEGMRQVVTENSNQDLNFVFSVIQNNETVPVILTDENDSVLNFRNLDSAKSKDIHYLKKELETMKQQHERIEIVISGNQKQFIYYKDSTILTKLAYYPFIQLAVIFLFILVSYFAFSVSRKAEQNQVWLGMSKETAHQLGTPISSLMAWTELLKLQDIDQAMVTELEKDVNRLQTITDRFSKVGSAPILVPTSITSIIIRATNYIKSRTSSKVQFNLHFQATEEIIVPLNEALFEWVIENLCKNAIDAMDGAGTIDIFVTDNVQVLYIDIKDTGKGIPKSKFKTIFQPGFTTKHRGWGLGLSLSKRIIETYHSGKIFVKSSEINSGTTFRIALKKRITA